MNTSSLALKILKKYFGYDSFRPLQAEIIENLVQKNDVLALMPTGGGKSLCYQIPALMEEGVGIVVSPLISLMKDQVEGLQENGVKAKYLNSSLSGPMQKEVEDQFFQGQLDLLYISPEKLLSINFFTSLKAIKILFFAIDEAHCISAWGHDFRPEYTQLGVLKKTMPAVPIIALTATADKVTRKDILIQLGISQARVFIASFDRPNIRLEVRYGQNRLPQISTFLKLRHRQPGIIYCLSRKSTEELSEKLNHQGFKTAFYHAGMDASLRSKVQEDFIKDQVLVICATIAFGMGIDKSNVRWVIHYNLPKNLEGYYQEIGRSGRDGEPADALLFYSLQDVFAWRDLLSNAPEEASRIQLSKLERIEEFAESQTCRRRILLNYFGENQLHNCGNCDNCENPPTFFDGTVIAQKALSAISRLNQSEGYQMVIDVLRGSRRQELLDKGYDKIKTYGAGHDLSMEQWRNYLLQLVHLGFVEFAPEEKNALKLLPSAQALLFEGKKVEMVLHIPDKQKREQEKQQATSPLVHDAAGQLFDKLKLLRRSIANEEKVAPYMVFSDATLKVMASNQPLDKEGFSQISGVGEHKLKKYSDRFLQAIWDHSRQNPLEFVGSSFLFSCKLFEGGMPVDAIGTLRALTESTVVGHLAQGYEKGYPVDIYRLVSEGEIAQVQRTIEKIKHKGTSVRPIYESMNSELSYEKIRLALVYLNRNSRQG